MNNFASVFKKSLSACIALAVTVIASGSADAQVLLSVNLTDPSAVTITATGFAPSSAGSGLSSGAGIELLGFFTGFAGFDIFAPTSSTLATTNIGATHFDGVAVDADTTSFGNQTGFDIFKSDDSSSLAFDLGKAAFTGSLTVNLSGYPLQSALAVGTTGNIIIGNYVAQGATIGQWEIVSAPEPSSWMLLAVCLLVLPLIRRFRRA